MTTLDTLYVVWQDPVTSRYFPVGRLRRSGTATEEIYEFVYTKGMDAARESGFEPFLSFPDGDKSYVSASLFPFFANRLLPSSREDYSDYIDQLGLSPATATAMEILARSGGRRITDSIELFAPPHIQKSTNGRGHVLDYLFLVHGIRHMKECSQLQAETNLRDGDSLFLLHDLQNAADPQALLLRTAGYCCVGFIPRFLCDDVWALFKDGENMRITVAKVNPPPAPVQQRVLCRLTGIARNHFVPCSSKDFQPKSRTDSVLVVRD